MSELLERLIGLEADVRYQEPATNGEAALRHIPGERAVLISAPHGAAYLGEGETGEEDEYTAALARLLGELCGAHVLYTRRRLACDPIMAAQEPYKRFLAELVAAQGSLFILDLHGASAPRNYGLALGTLHGKSCPDLHDLIIDTFQQHGFSRNGHGLQRLDIDRQQPATAANTVTRFAFEMLEVPAAQLFINAHLRIVRRFKDATKLPPFQGNPVLIERTIACLQDLAISIDQALDPAPGDDANEPPVLQ